jgi:hypothetical protein
VIVTKPRQILCGLLLVGAVLCCPPAPAGTLWYNGDLDNRDAFVNQTSALSGGAGFDGLIYENFVVPTGFTWTISGVFSNDVINPLGLTPAPTTAAWQIRSGVSANNGGTLVASGDGTDNFSPTGRDSTVFGPLFPSTPEYTNEVDGLSVTLGAGTYWLSVAPDTDGAIDAYWYASTTSGANAIGTPPGNDGNSFFTSNATGDFFTPTGDLEGPGNWDYSLGVVGTATPLATAAPEPSVVALAMGAGLSLAGYGLLGYAYRRRGTVTLAARV